MKRKETRRTVQLSSLTPHPLSVQVFGLEPGPELRESVRELGLLEDLVVAADGVTVISGSRRRAAMIAEGIKKANVRVREDLVEPLDIEDAVLDHNVRAPTSREHIARSLAARQRIGMDRETLAMKSAGKKGTPSASKVMKETASSSGQSIATTRRAISTIETADQLAEDGRADEANEILSTLNDVGFTPAKEAVDKIRKPKKRKSTPAASKPTAKPSGKLNATEAKRLAKAQGHLNSMTSSLPKKVFKDCETYIEMLREVFKRHGQGD